VRKRRGLGAPVDAFVVRHADVVGSLAFRDTDADTFGGTAARFGYAVNDGGARVVPGCVVLPAHKWTEVLRTGSVLPQR
jgi:hypothetical protein